MAVRASVIIVSRHRPALLRRCLTGLAQQDHPALEVIVVADPAGLAATQGFAVKPVAFDDANISAARNLGLAQAAADVVLFIDDDAVPEPTWASRLTAPFADPSVTAATGFVRGRNGISFQWKSTWVDGEGEEFPLHAEDVIRLHSAKGRAVKTPGTNCAFRRDTLAGLGGFDPAFRFYMDETDLNLRMAGHGLTAVVPDAQVHHGFAAGPYRRADRVPTTLHEIAASTALFLRRHAGGATLDHLATLIARERRRALGHMVTGRIEPRDVRHLMSSLTEGWQDGLHRPLVTPAPITANPPSFLPFRTLGPASGLVLSGWRLQQPALRAKAAQAVAEGRIVTLFLFTADVRPHHAGFSPDGYWFQSGGLFGRADRTEAVFRQWTCNARVEHELSRLCGLRALQ